MPRKFRHDLDLGQARLHALRAILTAPISRWVWAREALCTPLVAARRRYGP